MNTNELAALVDEAAVNAQPIAQLSLSSTFDVDQSYAIQLASMERRYARGEQLIGLKMGFTSYAKMEQMGVHDMIWGRLTDAMLVQDQGELSFDQLIHPRAEPEVCFRIARDIPGELDAEAVKAYVDGVAAAVEIIDSRYEQFKFSLEDVIADNCSSAALAIGPWQSPDQPLGELDMTLWIDGEAVQTGSSAAILGNPWESLASATRLAAQYGQPIKAGAVIMAGAATSAVFLKQGQVVRVTVQHLGETGFTVV